MELLRRLNERLAEQDKEIADLHKRVAELESALAKANKNSSTSSNPPSSDIVKPPATPKTGDGVKRKIGGQKGRPRHKRSPFLEE